MCDMHYDHSRLIEMHRYGSIISNIGAALVGGPGLVPGANIGREFALFEPGCRHVAKDIMVRRLVSGSSLVRTLTLLQGKDVANPAAMILSASMMLRHLGLDHHANQISNAVYDVISTGKIRSEDGAFDAVVAAAAAADLPPSLSFSLAAPDMGGSSHTTDFTQATCASL